MHSHFRHPLRHIDVFIPLIFVHALVFHTKLKKKEEDYQFRNTQEES